MLNATRMLGATRRQLLRHVYLPAALSWVLSSPHVAQPVPVHPARPCPEQRRARPGGQLIGAVEDEIQRTAGVDRDALHAELLERLDAPELDEGIEGRPVPGPGEPWPAPQPCARERAVELMHKLLERRPPALGP